MVGPPADDSTPNTDTKPTDGGKRGVGDRADATATGGGGDFEDPIGDLLPRADVDSRWWYWIAAIPLYVVIGGAAAVLLFFVVVLAGFGFGFEGGFIATGLLFVVLGVLGLVGLVLSILFPIATYIDARAIAASEASWTPDPLVWGLAALATEVLSAFTLSLVVALYYLYKRHIAVGTP
jgi:hypothetical protein